MGHGVSIAHAKRAARRAPGTCTATAVVGDDGALQAHIPLDVREARLRAGKTQDLRVILYKADAMGPTGDLRPIPTADGRHALALPLTIRPREGQQVAALRVSASLPTLAGQRVGLVVERVLPNPAPFVIAALLAVAAAAAVALGSWGDPTARKGHYEGKSRQEIQADLDRDIAWYEMEISVASRVTMREGSTSCELRVENAETNHCDQCVRVWETGSEGDVLYESGAIAPGEYLQTVELTHPLPVGTHTLTVQFQGYERQPTLLSDEGRLLGHDTFGASCAAEVTVEVVPTDG